MIDTWFAYGPFVLDIGNVFTDGLTICFVQSLQPFAHWLAAGGRPVEDGRDFSAGRHCFSVPYKVLFIGMELANFGFINVEIQMRSNVP